MADILSVPIDAHMPHSADAGVGRHRCRPDQDMGSGNPQVAQQSVTPGFLHLARNTASRR